MAGTIRKEDVGLSLPEIVITNKTGITRTKRAGTVVRELVVAVFDTAATDSSAVANTTIAAHGLGIYLPTKAIITNAWVDVVTTFTSATDAATIALKAEGTGDLTAALAISDASNVWDAGIHGCLPGSYAEATVAGDTAILDAARKAASFVKTTAVREITATVAVEVLTAGKANIYIEYVIGE
ncbi:MAG: hypothetical protein AAB403_03745 [Planctomycetota bacterium]